jgi:hypothetical protein
MESLGAANMGLAWGNWRGRRHDRNGTRRRIPRTAGRLETGDDNSRVGDRARRRSRYGMHVGMPAEIVINKEVQVNISLLSR